jgi:phage gp45-like
MSSITELAARVRNIFCLSDFQRRSQDGKIQVATRNGKVLEKHEAFPYGFCAKAQGGKALVFCQGGNSDDFEILPVKKDDVPLPELEEGDAALYTEKGGWVVVKNTGTVELLGKDAGGIVKAPELKQQLDKMTARIDGIINALKNAQTTAQDGGSAYKSGIVTALSALSDKEDFSKLESAKVLHGTGTH